jgi:hypothetical protein
MKPLVILKQRKENIMKKLTKEKLAKSLAKWLTDRNNNMRKAVVEDNALWLAEIKARENNKQAGRYVDEERWNSFAKACGCPTNVENLKHFNQKQLSCETIVKEVDGIIDISVKDPNMKLHNHMGYFRISDHGDHLNLNLNDMGYDLFSPAEEEYNSNEVLNEFLKQFETIDHYFEPYDSSNISFYQH